MTNNLDESGNETLMNAAFERVKPELLALPQDVLMQLNLDISAAVATVLGVLPALKALRSEVSEHLPTFKIERFDKLEDYALALLYAQAQFLSATQKDYAFEPLVDQATKVRERLLADARALVHHGVVEDDQLDQLKGAHGSKNVATDLFTLVSVMDGVWPAIKGKTLTTAEDLEAASRLAARLLRATGLREQGPAAAAEEADLRRRAYTMLLLVYEDARRAVRYLRSETEDAHEIAPALHRGRPRRRRTEEEDTLTGGSVPANADAAGVPRSPPPVVPTNGGSVASVNASSVSQHGPFLS